MPTSRVQDLQMEANDTFAASIALAVAPEAIRIPLTPGPGATRMISTASIWRRVHAEHAARVVLRSAIEQVRLIRLTIVSDAPAWNARWLRWSFASRRVSESAGGSAVTAQDTLSSDGRTLTLLILPGEERVVSLESGAELDGETYPGSYPFDVVASDSESAAENRFSCHLTLHHPPSSMLEQLPSIYTSALEETEPQAGGFRDSPFFVRYLLGFEDERAPLDSLLGVTERLVDADVAPEETLTWLATWVSLVLDENWPELKKRRLIKEAVDLYRWRGTRRGLSRYLEIYTGITPHIDDRPLSGIRLGPNAKLGPEARLGDVPPHTFVVTVATQTPETIDLQTVRRIIESEKPAHTAYDVRVVRSSDD